MNNENLHPIFKDILDTINPQKQAQNDEDTKMEDLSVIARKSHNNNFLTWQYEFLHLTPENEATYELGCMAGVMYATGKLQRQTDKIVISEENEKTLHY